MESHGRVTGQAEVEAVFREQVPTALVLNLMRMIREGYRSAHEQAFSSLDPRIAAQAYPVWRQWLLEELFRSLGDRHASEGAASHVRYSSRSRTPHTVLTVGRVAFTLAKTDEEDERPRQSLYRQSYQMSQQLVMPSFEDLVPDVPDEAPRLEGVDVYYVITHGPEIRDTAVPAFVKANVYDAAGAVIGSVELVALARDAARILQEAAATPQSMPAVRSRKSKKVEKQSQ